MQDIMIDLETMGTTADAAIISIGAVKFNKDTFEMSKDPFYASISVDSNTRAQRRISESTLVWWMGQSPEAQLVFTEPKIDLEAGLHLLSEWIDDPDCQVWSNGADFDIPMLAHAFASYDMDTPWKFWNTNCYRTIKKLPAAKAAMKPENPVQHNALQDALFQALHLQNIFNAMKGLA